MPYLFLLLCFSLITQAAEPALQHAKTYNTQDINNWLMSEKLDGIRGYWDGKIFLSKKGRPLHPPQHFTDNFPPFELDGELWTKRQDFETIQSKLFTHQSDWKGVSYNIFEVPHGKGNFYKRLDKAKRWFKQHPNSHVHFIAQKLCQDKKTLALFLESVVKKGGEGVMVKNPNLAYRAGRTSTLLKVKKAYDMEGIVTVINMYPKRPMFKSLTLQLPNNISFKLGNGFSKETREQLPDLGTKVTFKYYGFTKKGKPKFASFLHYRLAQ